MGWTLPQYRLIVKGVFLESTDNGKGSWEKKLPRAGVEDRQREGQLISSQSKCRRADDNRVETMTTTEVHVMSAELFAKCGVSYLPGTWPSLPPLMIGAAMRFYLGSEI